MIKNDFNYKGRPVEIEMSKYIENENIYLGLVHKDTRELLCSITTNLRTLEGRYVGNVGNLLITVKTWSENIGIEDFLIKSKIVFPDPIAVIPTGFVKAPVYELTNEAHELVLAKLNEREVF